MHFKLVMTAPYQFNTNELLTLGIAAYAAIVSTFVLGWDAYKWLAAGPRIQVEVMMNMRMIGGSMVKRTGPSQEQRFVMVTATNVGDRPTTITNLGGMFYESWWDMRRRKVKQAFLVNAPSQAQPIPHRFEVGDQWVGLADQTPQILQMAESGYLFLILYTSDKKKGYRARVRAKPDAKPTRKAGDAA